MCFPRLRTCHSPSRACQDSRGKQAGIPKVRGCIGEWVSRDRLARIGKTVFSAKVLIFMPGITVISMDNYNVASRFIDDNFD
ncbi:unnamed protein product, partial [Closterium sp. NIES-54]